MKSILPDLKIIGMADGDDPEGLAPAALAETGFLDPQDSMLFLINNLASLFSLRYKKSIVSFCKVNFCCHYSLRRVSRSTEHSLPGRMTENKHS